MPQLNPMIPFDTPKGEGFAFWRDEISQEHDTLYTVIITATREVWDFRQSEVRGVKNVTMGRTAPATPFENGRSGWVRWVHISGFATVQLPEGTAPSGPWTRAK